MEPDEILHDQKQELRARNISKNIRCMICQNQSIDESNAPLAKDLRVLIRNKIKDGKKNKEIYKSEVKTFMIDVLNFEINNYKNKIKFRTLFSFNKFKSFINTLCDNILLNFKKDALLTENISLLDMHAETSIFTKNMEYFRLFLSNINRISKSYKKNITFVIIPSKYRLNAPDINTARSPIKYNITRNKVLTNIIAKSYDVKLIDNKYRISELDYGSYIIDLTNIIMEENKNNIIFL